MRPMSAVIFPSTLDPLPHCRIIANGLEINIQRLQHEFNGKVL